MSAAARAAGTVCSVTTLARPALQLESLLDEPALAAASDAQLADTAAAIVTEQHRRALAANDLDALVEEAFEIGFNGRGEPATPWLVGALLICTGSRRNKSATSHECTFVSVDGSWVWASEELIVDDMRDAAVGAKQQKRSVSIVGAVEGMQLDLVSSASRSGGPCEMKTATSFLVERGQLVKVATRARKPNGHR